jgi:hypothetical protein
MNATTTPTLEDLNAVFRIAQAQLDDIGRKLTAMRTRLAAMRLKTDDDEEAAVRADFLERSISKQVVAEAVALNRMREAESAVNTARAQETRDRQLAEYPGKAARLAARVAAIARALDGLVAEAHVYAVEAVALSDGAQALAQFGATGMQVPPPVREVLARLLREREAGQRGERVEIFLPQ